MIDRKELRKIANENGSKANKTLNLLASAMELAATEGREGIFYRFRDTIILRTEGIEVGSVDLSDITTPCLSYIERLAVIQLLKDSHYQVRKCEDIGIHIYW